MVRGAHPTVPGRWVVFTFRRVCTQPAEVALRTQKRLDAAMNTAGSAGLVYHNLAQGWELRMQLLPNPAGEVFAGGIFEAGDFVQVTMIERVVKRLEGARELSEVLHPTAVGIDRAADMYFDAERVAV